MPSDDTQSSRHIIHLIAPGIPGGAEAVILALAKADPKRTHVVALNQLANESDPPHPFVDVLRAEGIDSSEIRSGRRRYMAEVRVLTHRVRSSGSTLIHTHGYHAHFVGYLAARKTGIPAVATTHGYITRNSKERLFNLIDRRLLRRFDAVIAVSARLQSELIHSGVRRDKVHLVENGLGNQAEPLTRAQARAELGLPADGAMIGWIGRLSREKGPDLLLQAVREAKVDATAVVIGDGPEREALNETAQSYGLIKERRVHFAGYRKNASSFLSAFDLLALTSRTEGMPMVILEAIAATLPIVAFAVGGVPDILDAQCAWLVPPGDTIGLAAAMREALSAPHARTERAAAALARNADRLSVNNWVERIQEVYQSARRSASLSKPAARNRSA